MQATASATAPPCPAPWSSLASCSDAARLRPPGPFGSTEMHNPQVSSEGSGGPITRAVRVCRSKRRRLHWSGFVRLGGDHHKRFAARPAALRPPRRRSRSKARIGQISFPRRLSDVSAERLDGRMTLVWRCVELGLRSMRCRKVSSPRETECQAGDGGHDGRLADSEAVRHHIVMAVRTLSESAIWRARRCHSSRGLCLVLK